ncbi:MAG: arylamine N-acetyltransferase [Kofleriaceae bacterium]|nr:arylamine N-acetyltransferase [Kofleriaceae bacterium]
MYPIVGTGRIAGMDIQAYLRRIAYSDTSGGTSHVCDLRTLRALVQAHLYAVPFENFDIHLGVPIRLNPEVLFDKIVVRQRGGFCYELNTLFAELLRGLGYKVDLLAARVYRKKKLGPAFDHMALRVHIGAETYLVDVGFGDASAGPLPLKSGASQREKGSSYSLYDSSIGLYFEFEASGGDTRGYALSLHSYELSDFASMCLHHQRSARSWFTQERICILQSESGSLSLIEGKYKAGSETSSLSDNCQYLEVLATKFGIVLAGLPENSSKRFAMRWQKRALRIEDTALQLGMRFAVSF